MSEAATAPSTAPTAQPWRLWKDKAPLAIGDEPLDIPTITLFAPEKPDGSAIVVCPGGGYAHLADHEGAPIAKFLNQTGITAFVLKYRLGPRYHHPAPLMDVSRAIRTVRHRAKELNLDPQRIGVMGFSAGGHLTATISTIFDTDDRDAQDPIDQESARPDIAVLCYPVITFEGVSAHLGSRKNLLGENPPAELLDHLSAEKNVNPHTPPSFIFHTVSDNGVPIENSMMYAAALRKNGIPFEAHFFQPGRHGVGLAEKDPVLKAWPGLCAAWLATHKFGQRASTRDGA
jgi:acetyl esterase/lipase